MLCLVHEHLREQPATRALATDPRAGATGARRGGPPPLQGREVAYWVNPLARVAKTGGGECVGALSPITLRSGTPLISKILNRGSSLVERWRALRPALARLVATAREVPLNVSLDTVKRRAEPFLELLRKRAARIPLPSGLRRSQPRTLQSHILVLFLVLMVVVQVGGFALINTVGMAAARKSIGEDLVSGALVFDRLLDQETHRLVQGAHLMSSDYTFREVIASGDLDTIASVLTKYGRRVDASLMMVIGLDQRVLGDTFGIGVGKP